MTNFPKKILPTLAFTIAISFMNAQVVTTLAGCGGHGSTDGIGAAACFRAPYGITADGNGNLYVADANNHEIRKIVIATREVTTLAGNTMPGSADGTGTAASFNDPRAVAFDGGNLYVADYGNNEIRKIVIATGVVTTLAGITTAGSANGTGTAASFNSPNGIAADGNGNLYVGDFGNNEIRKIIITTGVVTTLAGTTTAGSTDGTGATAHFNGPSGSLADGNGNLYVCDYLNNEIRKIVIATGSVTTLAGNTMQGSADGKGTAAYFNDPVGIATDGNGNLYVADRSNNEIRKIVISTGAVTTIEYTTTTGTATAFNTPDGVAIDQSGNLFVTVTGENEIQEITNATGILQNSMPNTQFNVYPNPAVDYLTVKLPSNSSKTEIKIFNIIGELEYSSTETNQNKNIDISNLANGLYLIQIATDDNMGIQKFIKQ